MVVLCCIVVVTGFLPSPVSRSSLSSPPSQVVYIWMFPKIGGGPAKWMVKIRVPNPYFLMDALGFSQIFGLTPIYVHAFLPTFSCRLKRLRFQPFFEGLWDPFPHSNHSTQVFNGFYYRCDRVDQLP